MLDLVSVSGTGSSGSVELSHIYMCDLSLTEPDLALGLPILHNGNYEMLRLSASLELMTDNFLEGLRANANISSEHDNS